MSARNWAWEQEDRYSPSKSTWVPLTSPEKFVLLCLAELENVKEGYAFPSVNTIATRCRLGRRTVSNALAALEESELLQRDLDMRDRSGKFPQNHYFLTAVTPEHRNADKAWVSAYGEAF